MTSEFAPEILDRRMYGHRPDTPEIQQENDVEGSFVDAPVGLSADLLAIIHEQQSVDLPKVEVEKELDVGKISEENPNSRFRILNLAIRKPGVCFVCGSDGNDERQFVDFGKTVDWYGVVYICTFCVFEVAKLLGLGLKSDWVLAQKNLQEEISKGDVRWIEAREELRAARLLLRNCHCDNSNSSDSGPDSVQVDVESDPVPEQTSTDADESGDVQESGDVSETSVDDDGVAREVPAEKPKRTRRGSSSS